MLRPPRIYQDVNGWSALRTGLSWLFMNAPFLLMAQLAGRIERRQPPSQVVAAGCLVAAIGIFALSRAGTTTPFALTAIGYLLAGAGFGLRVPGLIHVAMRDVPAGVSGAASGVVNAVRQISVGLAVLGSIGVSAAISHWHTTIHRFPATAQAAAAHQAQNVAGAHISAVTKALGPTYRDAAAQSFVHGYHLAVGTAAACLLAAADTALLGFRRPSPTTPAAVALEGLAGPTGQESSVSAPNSPTRVTSNNGHLPATQPVRRDSQGLRRSAEQPNIPRSRMPNGGCR